MIGSESKILMKVSYTLVYIASIIFWKNPGFHRFSLYNLQDIFWILQKKKYDLNYLTTARIGVYSNKGEFYFLIIKQTPPTNEPH